jgi:hypothetical protein
MFVERLFQVDADGYMDTEKAVSHIKSKDQWGQLFANKDDVIKRCVTLANSFSKGKLNFRIQGSRYILKVTYIKLKKKSTSGSPVNDIE